MRIILNEFEFRPDRTTELFALEHLKNRLIMGKMVSPLFLGCFRSDPFDRASTNFQNQEVQDFQPSKSGSEANET